MWLVPYVSKRLVSRCYSFVSSAPFPHWYKLHLAQLIIQHIVQRSVEKWRWGIPTSSHQSLTFVSTTRSQGATLITNKIMKLGPWIYRKTVTTGIQSLHVVIKSSNICWFATQLTYFGLHKLTSLPTLRIHRGYIVGFNWHGRPEQNVYSNGQINRTTKETRIPETEEPWITKLVLMKWNCDLEIL